MKPFSKTKVLILIIGVLLAANIAELALLLTKKEVHEHKSAIIARFLQQQIGFNDTQLKQYDSLHDIHHDKIKGALNEMENTRNEDFKHLCSIGFGDSAINATAQHSVEKQQLLELQLLQYVKDIRNICTPDQQSKFDTTFYKVFRQKN